MIWFSEVFVEEFWVVVLKLVFCVSDSIHPGFVSWLIRILFHISTCKDVDSLFGLGSYLTPRKRKSNKKQKRQNCKTRKAYKRRVQKLLIGNWTRRTQRTYRTHRT